MFPPYQRKGMQLRAAKDTPAGANQEGVINDHRRSARVKAIDLRLELGKPRAHVHKGKAVLGVE